MVHGTTLDVAPNPLRDIEYGYLDRTGHLYLDYTGSGLAAESQLRAHAERLGRGVYGNPHSENPTSLASTRLIESARMAVLRHLNADPAQYAVVFTANATGACRLVGEAYPFGRRAGLVLTTDNHNSVNGLREFARRAGARTRLVPVLAPELRLDGAVLQAALSRGRGLFAYPAQSNFSGVRHPLDQVREAQRRGYDVLLDTAAYLPTNRLDLSVVQPEFVTASWYKVFGLPTGVGSLVARRDALARLRRPWFSGGTITAVSAAGDWHWLAQDGQAFEDGTPDFLAIPDVEVGLDWIRSVGPEAVHRRVTALTARLLDGLTRLRHSNGTAMVIGYGPMDTRDRGGTVAFNLLDPSGAPVDERLVERESAAARISLRTGCFCNPGAGEAAFRLTRDALRAAGRRGAHTVDAYLDRLGLPIGGAVRVSLGIASTAGDVDRFMDFLEASYRDRPATTDGLGPRLHC